jgi:hypothetical protein
MISKGKEEGGRGRKREEGRGDERGRNEDERSRSSVQ